MSIRPSEDVDLARLAQLASVALAEASGHVVTFDELGRVESAPDAPRDLFARACGMALVQMGHPHQVIRCADHMVGQTSNSGCAGITAAEAAAGHRLRCGA